MKAKLNRTERQRVKRSDVTITVDQGASVLVSITGDLTSYGFASGATVVIDVSRKARSERLAVGKASRPFELLSAALSFDTPEGLTYDLKVISPSDGRLLGIASNLKPESTGDGEAESLLRIRAVNNLGQRLWRLDFDNGPLLEINDGIADWREYVRKPDFQSLVYPEALRQIAQRVVLDEPSPDGPLHDWSMFLDELGFPENSRPRAAPGEDLPNLDDVEHFADDVVKAFCSRHGILARILGAQQ